MSLAVLADHMASKGRNGDTMLVHMAPEEVRGLHALAAAHGGALTINPETGLPEANFLKKLLPTIIGAGISFFSGGTIDPITAAAIVGGVETARTGDLSKGVMAGLGAYGGASFSAGLGAAGTSAGIESAVGAAAPAVSESEVARLMLETGADKDVIIKQLQREALEKATTEAATRSFSDRAMMGLEGLTSEAGRGRFMDAMGGGKGLFQAGYMAAAPMLAAEAVQAKMPQTTTPMGRISFMGMPRGQQGDYSLRGYGYYTPEEFMRLGGFQGMRERMARGEDIPPPGAAKGGLMGLAEGGVTYSSGNTPSYQRASMSPGMLDFAQKSEPVVRMADGGFTDDQVASAIRTSLQQGFDPQQTLAKAATLGATQDQLQRSLAALQQSGYSNLTMPTFPSAAPPTAPVAAPVSTPAAGLAALAPAAQQTSFVPNTFAPGSLRGDVYGAFLGGQQSGNFANLQREINEGKLTSTDIAALFPQLTKAGVEQFGRERGLTFATKPGRIGYREMEPDNPLNRPANLQSDVFVQGINTALQQAGAPALDMPALQATADLAQPYRYRDTLAEAFQTAQQTGDYSNFSDLLAERDISKTELRNIFQNVTNPAIAEFEKRGVKFSALPDWIGQKGTVDARGNFIPSAEPVDLGAGVKMDVATAEDYARQWQSLYNRDIAPQELRELQTAGVKPTDIKPVSLASLGRNPSQLQLVQAGVLPYLAADPGEYDWASISASADPLAAIQDANRALNAQASNAKGVTVLGTVGGIQLAKREFPGNPDATTLTFGGRDVRDKTGLYEAATKFGLNSQEINQLADLMDASGVSYLPGEPYSGVDVGYDPRAVAAGSYGTKDFLPLSNKPEYTMRTPEQEWYASQLGLAINREEMPKIGEPLFTPETLRPGTDRSGNPMRYGVIGGGGSTVSYFNDLQDALTRAPQQGVYGPVVDLSGRSPFAEYTAPAQRPGDVIATPTSGLRAGLDYVQSEGQKAAATAAATAPAETTQTRAGLAALSTDPTQQAVPTEAQLAAQRGILADPVKAARAEAISGIAAGKTDQQIADAVNSKYGKSFSAQNVADFMKAQGITRPASTVVKDDKVVTTPAVTYVPPFQPTVQTMEQLRSGYVQGGGRVDTPTIGDIGLADRIYTQNRVYQALIDYLRDNPNAIYGDVAKLAKQLGVPEQQLRAAVNEYRFSSMTGGSKQAYDYLMGRGEAPTKPYVPGGGPISRSYADAMGITGGYQSLKPVMFTPAASSSTTTSKTVTAPSGAKLTEAERSALGNTFVQAQQSGNYTGFNAMLQSLQLTPDDLVALFPSITPKAVQEAIDKGYVKVYEPPVIGGKAGGLMDIAAAGAAGGGQFNLGSYSDGGRLLRGPGDGVSDSIPATIGGKRPARLADGEFVVPARIVSELGNGSTEAGARKLYAMMDRVQRARSKSVGKGKVAKDTKADKYLPA